VAEVRGVLINGMKAFLTDTYGPAEVETSLSELPPDEAALIRRKCLDATFYPFETMIAQRHQMRALAAEHPKGAHSLPEQCGVFLADYVFKGVYRAFLANDAPSMAAKVPWVKDFFYKDLEQVTVEVTGPSSCRLTYRYEPGVRHGRAVCRSLLAFWSHALELAGGKRVVSTHGLCISDGADHCEFALSW
jgi:hypothetical protein